MIANYDFSTSVIYNALAQKSLNFLYLYYQQIKFNQFYEGYLIDNFNNVCLILKWFYVVNVKMSKIVFNKHPIQIYPRTS